MQRKKKELKQASWVRTESHQARSWLSRSEWWKDTAHRVPFLSLCVHFEMGAKSLMFLLPRAWKEWV
jgi:hypothetical protein